MLLTAGCSMVYGDELHEENGLKGNSHWPLTFTHKLSEHLGIKYSTLSRNGASNHLIFRRLIQWFAGDPTLCLHHDDSVTPETCTHMVVLWSEIDRSEVYMHGNSDYCEDNGLYQVRRAGEHIDTDVVDWDISDEKKDAINKYYHQVTKDNHVSILHLLTYIKTIEQLCKLNNIKLIQAAGDASIRRGIAKSHIKGASNDSWKVYFSKLINPLSKTSKIGITGKIKHGLDFRTFTTQKPNRLLMLGHPNAEAHAEYAEHLYNIFQEDFSELNDVPTTSVVFTAADSKYFHMFGTEFVYSFSRMGHDVHVHLVNPDEKCHDLAKKLKSVCRTKVTFSHEVTDIQQYRKDGEDDTYYTCARWIKLPEILESAGEVMVLDIDCMARKPFVFPHNENLGFYPRFDNEDSNMKILGGIFYITKEKIKLANRIKDSILKNPMEYYVDQIVLHEELKNETEYFKFDDDFCAGDVVDAGCNRFLGGDCVIGIDGELTNFNENSIIWTGKGLLKFKHPQYLELFEYWQKEFQSEGEKK
jgi:hypothetical protein